MLLTEEVDSGQKLLRTFRGKGDPRPQLGVLGLERAQPLQARSVPALPNCRFEHTNARLGGERTPAKTGQLLAETADELVELPERGGLRLIWF